MINISKRYDKKLKYREDMETYLEEHPDRKVALERVMKIEIDCMVGDSKEFGTRHITIAQPIDVKLNKDFVDLLEKMNRGESCVIDKPITLELDSALCIVGE